MALRDEMVKAWMALSYEEHFIRDLTEVCAEVAERHYAPIEAERRELLARIAELERTIARHLNGEVARPDNVVIIDGRQWRIERHPTDIRDLYRLVPVEDTE